MSLTDISIKRPVFMTMVLLSFVLFGCIGFFRMGVDLMPKVEIPVITVVSILPGSDPQTTETMVTDPIEEALSTISSIKTIRSKSGDGVSQVIIEFELDKDINIAFQEVQAKINAIRSSLPNDLIAPVIQKIDIDALPILSVFLSGPYPIDELTDIAKKEVKETLQRLPDIGEIRMIGGREKKMWIYLDRDRLQSHQITVAELEQALKMHHVEIPGGKVQTPAMDFPVKVNAEFATSEDLANWIVSDRKGSLIRIKDLGHVEESLEDEKNYSQYNGVSAISLAVQKQSGSNTIAVAQAVKDQCKTIQNLLAKRNINLQIAQDSSLFIHSSVNEVYWHLLFGGFLAILIVWIFLRNLRSTFVSALALPTAVIGTFTFMYFMGFTQNVITLLALSIAIGLLIDDAIVVQENIMRHIEMGHSPKEAACVATRQIALAVMTTTLSVVAVFIPIAFVKGMIGRFFYQFGLTVTFAVLISLFVSFTLNPMFSAYFLKEQKSSRFYDFLEKIFRSIENSYRHVIQYSLTHRKTVLAITAVCLLSAFVSAKWIKFEFRPMEDQSQFQIVVNMPKGSSIDVTKHFIKKIEASLKTQPWLSYTFSTVGGDQMQSAHNGTIYVKMIEKKERSVSQEKAMEQMRTLLAGLPVGKTSVEPFNKMAGGMGSTEINLEIKGPDLEKLGEYSRFLIDQMNHSTGYRDVHISDEGGKPQINIAIRRDLAADLGVSPLMVASTIRTAIGGTDVAKFKSGKDRYNIGIRLDREYRQEFDQIELLSVKNNVGKLIPLRNVIETIQTEGPSEIERYNRSRKITLLANLDHKEKVIGQAMKEIEQIVQKMDLPLGYSIEFSGQAKMLKESMTSMLMALILGILIIYMVLAAQFESFIYPFVIMLSLPLSLIGALGSHVIFGQSMSIFSMLGIIMLMGLVTKNGILLVDLANTIYAKNPGDCFAAVCEAGKLRLRPILMTTLAVIFGMLPIALGVGSGSESQAPMAISVIGGLITSTLLTLVVIPVVYTLVDDLKKKAKHKADVSQTEPVAIED